MIQNIQHGTLVEMLLNTLEVERHVRRPLLYELIGELSATDGAEGARLTVSALLERLERGELTDAELTCAIGELRARLARDRAGACPETCGGRGRVRRRSARRPRAL